MIQQARWIFHGSDAKNFSYAIIEKYLTDKMLAKAGYVLNQNELESWEIDAYHLIENVFSREEKKKLKR